MIILLEAKLKLFIMFYFDDTIYTCIIYIHVLKIDLCACKTGFHPNTFSACTKSGQSGNSVFADCWYLYL